MNYHKIEKYSIANGLGIRVVLWISGCRCYCKNCQNPQTWSFNSGKLFDENAQKELFEALDKPYIRGITFSGGHPLEPENLSQVLELINLIKEKLPEKDIWLYTGYELTIDDFKGTSIFNKVLQNCDIIIDGPYIESKRNITLNWRGSSNQRVIDVKKTIEKNKIISKK